VLVEEWLWIKFLSSGQFKGGMMECDRMTRAVSRVVPVKYQPDITDLLLKWDYGDPVVRRLHHYTKVEVLPHRRKGSGNLRVVAERALGAYASDEVGGLSDDGIRHYLFLKHAKSDNYGLLTFEGEDGDPEYMWINGYFTTYIHIPPQNGRGPVTMSPLPDWQDALAFNILRAARVSGGYAVQHTLQTPADYPDGKIEDDKCGSPVWLRPYDYKTSFVDPDSWGTIRVWLSSRECNRDRHAKIHTKIVSQFDGVLEVIDRMRVYLQKRADRVLDQLSESYVIPGHPFHPLKPQE